MQRKFIKAQAGMQTVGKRGEMNRPLSTPSTLPLDEASIPVALAVDPFWAAPATMKLEQTCTIRISKRTRADHTPVTTDQNHQSTSIPLPPSGLAPNRRWCTPPKHAQEQPAPAHQNQGALRTQIWLVLEAVMSS
uniref:Uncharacterized protein n=1 Tax=Eutreptiella gymnastica TaxID=73025 RepID=A0A7S1JIJ5_9EUGL|mmetsp:Transcript_99315/g.170939  ORF Transcript_99315/g.170939 Transcript_99315/m.170939 type:complete len:135 (+) Transcript_99315:130-534(+)